MLDAFYTAMSPAALALLGLWLVAVQMRADEVRASRELSRRTYAVALFFALPGLMSVMALVDTANPTSRDQKVLQQLATPDQLAKAHHSF